MRLSAGRVSPRLMWIKPRVGGKRVFVRAYSLGTEKGGVDKDQFGRFLPK